MPFESEVIGWSTTRRCPERGPSPTSARATARSSATGVRLNCPGGHDSGGADGVRRSRSQDRGGVDAESAEQVGDLVVELHADLGDAGVVETGNRVLGRSMLNHTAPARSSWIWVRSGAYSMTAWSWRYACSAMVWSCWSSR